jgi:hypothetical protein
MEATQKRRMWKVAIAHFLLTLFVAVKLGLPLVRAAYYQRETWLNGWGGFWEKFFWLLQPQSFLYSVIRNLPTFRNFIPTHSGPVLLTLLFLAIPLWSICFSWIYVKFTNRLNHFPVLGKKVF